MLQGTEEWRRARAGSLGASCFHEAIARVKNGWGAGRKNLMGRLIAERLTGMPLENFSSAAMRWGTETEPEARAAYAFYQGVNVEPLAIAYHPSILGSHASPDGCVDGTGGLEIKCPETATHIETLLTQRIDKKYLIQMQWQMACTGWPWVDFVSYDPRMPDEMQIFIQRVASDAAKIKEMEEQARQFLKELRATLVALCEKHGVPMPEWSPVRHGVALPEAMEMLALG
jgi:putative phage-type endonuclease